MPCNLSSLNAISDDSVASCPCLLHQQGSFYMHIWPASSISWVVSRGAMLCWPVASTCPWHCCIWPQCCTRMSRHTCTALHTARGSACPWHLSLPNIKSRRLSKPSTADAADSCRTTNLHVCATPARVELDPPAGSDAVHWPT